MADQPEIPDLKKKDKERKKGALLWRGAGGVADPFTGATGGIARSAASAASAIAEAGGEGAAEEGAGLVSRALSRLLGPLYAPLEQFAATTLGKLAIAGLIAAIVGGGVMLSRMMSAGASPSAGMAGGDNLGPIADSIKIHTGSSSGLDYAARANQGALANPQAVPQAAPKAAVAAQPAAAQPRQQAQKPATPTLDNAAIQANQQHLAHNMSGTQLSTSFGADFGQNNIFSGGKNGQFSSGSLAAMTHAAANQGLASSQHAVNARAASMNLGRRGFGMSGALGHLLTMAGMNRTMLSAPAQENASQTASDQFQSQQTTGGAAPTTPVASGATQTGGGGASAGSGGGTPSIPGGSGAGSCTTPGQVFDGTSCVSPTNPNGVDVTPWESMLSSAMGMINSAVTMIMMASAIFTAMWITSLALKTNPWTYTAGVVLELAGLAFAATMTGMAMMIGGQIQQLGQSVASAGSQTIGSGVANIGGLIKSMAWTSITGIGGMILSFMILSKESSVMGSLGQQMDAGASPQSGIPAQPESSAAGSAPAGP